jgi:drug/metabolite transporter (DMT)-like permease
MSLSAAAAAAGAPGILVPVVLAAAILHASWNAILKFVPDKATGSFLMSATSAVLASVAVFFFAVPDRSSWIYLGISIFLHVGYFMMLVKTFEIGDFNQVYPLARGLSPVLVALFAEMIGDPMSGQQTLGIAIVCGGLAALVFSAGRPRRAQSEALFWAVATGLSIAVYTVVDGMGVRRSGGAAGYTAWMMVLEGWALAACCLVLMARRRRAEAAVPDADPALIPADLRKMLTRITPPDLLRGFIAGALMPLAYGLVLWAQTRGALAAVSALRETSVIFGAALGSLFLREPFGRYRILAAVTIAGGILILEMA